MSALDIAGIVFGAMAFGFILYLLYVLLALRMANRNFEKIVKWMGLDK